MSVMEHSQRKFWWGTRSDSESRSYSICIVEFGYIQLSNCVRSLIGHALVGRVISTGHIKRTKSLVSCRYLKRASKPSMG